MIVFLDCSVNPDDCPQTTDACGHGTCVDSLDTYTCSCDAGYEGDHCQSESRGSSVLMTVYDLGIIYTNDCGMRHDSDVSVADVFQLK